MKKSFFYSLLLFIKGIFTLIFGIVLWLFGSGSQKKFEAGYSAFLAGNNGQKFFFTTGDAHLRKLMETQFIPLLPHDVNVVYVTKNSVTSNFNPRHMRAMMYRMKDKNRLPALFIIQNGKVKDMSVKKELMATFDDYKKMAHLKDKMESFFNS